ncbi:MAG: SDR family oxidoreductase [Gammaproteobacteria bacterium]|nr:SDR family oxidoreductase [Gammaproteobacteria bacterium]
MKVLVTGTSQGIGKAIALKFISEGHTVYGFDIKKGTIDSPLYNHYIVNIGDIETYPALPFKFDILINNAGVQNTNHDIETNLKGTINITENYGINDNTKAILFIASASAHTGFEFPNYVASKAGIIGYMKNVASRLSKNKAVVNSLSLGGVYTPLNDVVVKDKEMFNKIMDVTPLKKWMDTDEVATWVYFLTVINKSMSGQDLLIDNGEKDLNNTFVWPNYKK